MRRALSSYISRYLLLTLAARSRGERRRGISPIARAVAACGWLAAPGALSRGEQYGWRRLCLIYHALISASSTRRGTYRPVAVTAARAPRLLAAHRLAPLASSLPLTFGAPRAHLGGGGNIGGGWRRRRMRQAASPRYGVAAAARVAAWRRLARRRSPLLRSLSSCARARYRGVGGVAVEAPRGDARSVRHRATLISRSPIIAHHGAILASARLSNFVAGTAPCVKKGVIIFCSR